MGGENDAHDWPDNSARKNPTPTPPKVKCPHCGRMTGGLDQHIAAKHADKAGAQ